MLFVAVCHKKALNVKVLGATVGVVTHTNVSASGLLTKSLRGVSGEVSHVGMFTKSLPVFRVIPFGNN